MRIDLTVTERPVFRQFETVVSWLDRAGWHISWQELHWQGYVRYVFNKLSPTIPMPGQLKNLKLLREYLASAPREQSVLERSTQEMDRRYQRVLLPELRSVRARAALGLRRH